MSFNDDIYVLHEIINITYFLIGSIPIKKLMAEMKEYVFLNEDSKSKIKKIIKKVCILVKNNLSEKYINELKEKYFSEKGLDVYIEFAIYKKVLEEDQQKPVRETNG